jgi:hypothetical protein
MMEQYRAIREEDALPTIQAFVARVKADQVISFSGPVRETRTRNGRAVVFDPPAQTFPAAFRVSLVGSRTVRISEGTVNGRIPLLDGRGLTGLKEDGSAHPEGPPSLELTEEPEKRWSWVCLQASATIGNGDLLPGEEGLTVVHRLSLPQGVPYGLDEQMRGLRPIAQLTWNGDRTRIERVRQILYYDQVYRAPRGEDPRPEWLAAS